MGLMLAWLATSPATPANAPHSSLRASDWPPVDSVDDTVRPAAEARKPVQPENTSSKQLKSSDPTAPLRGRIALLEQQLADCRQREPIKTERLAEVNPRHYLCREWKVTDEELNNYIALSGLVSDDADLGALAVSLPATELKELLDAELAALGELITLKKNHEPSIPAEPGTAEWKRQWQERQTWWTYNYRPKALETVRSLVRLFHERGVPEALIASFESRMLAPYGVQGEYR